MLADIAREAASSHSSFTHSPRGVTAPAHGTDAESMLLPASLCTLDVATFSDKDIPGPARGGSPHVKDATLSAPSPLRLAPPPPGNDMLAVQSTSRTFAPVSSSPSTNRGLPGARLRPLMLRAGIPNGAADGFRTAPPPPLAEGTLAVGEPRMLMDAASDPAEKLSR
ncbi:hypothetical protein Vafri_4953 [Volvox africanus]|uniref:Uncharacterized protein n=1 Tax=Volvox africanus TaxID=51714 RepID=A0A8J4EXY8_9CHLO|nr:hypothetical protein Vafri_4953 [Volvox africanus]